MFNFVLFVEFEIAFAVEFIVLFTVWLFTTGLIVVFWVGFGTTGGVEFTLTAP